MVKKKGLIAAYNKLNKLAPPPYSYGVPGWIIWGSHLLIAGFMIALGVLMLREDENGEPIHDKMAWAIVLIVIASLAAAYHLHLAYAKR